MKVQECVAEAHQAKYMADEVYDEAINSSETIEIELVWDAIDNYKAAVIKARDRDIEIEAECVSKMATIFEKILFVKETARAYHYNCLELAESMKPKTFYSCTWYLKSKAAVERYQKEVVDEEDKEKEAKRSTVIDKIKPIITEINTQFKKLPKGDFLKYLYEKHSHPKKNHKLDEEKLSTNLKNCYRNAAVHYHPDKNDEKENGLEWHFICEEISKLINNNYENLKSAQ